MAALINGGSNAQIPADLGSVLAIFVFLRAASFTAGPSQAPR
jgi:hypothetical protein